MTLTKRYNLLSGPLQTKDASRSHREEEKEETKGGLPACYILLLGLAPPTRFVTPNFFFLHFLRAICFGLVLAEQ
jgi:hypothetical protein